MLFSCSFLFVCSPLFISALRCFHLLSSALSPLLSSFRPLSRRLSALLPFPPAAILFMSTTNPSSVPFSSSPMYPFSSSSLQPFSSSPKYRYYTRLLNSPTLFPLKLLPTLRFCMRLNLSFCQFCMRLHLSFSRFCMRLSFFRCVQCSALLYLTPSVCLRLPNVLPEKYALPPSKCPTSAQRAISVFGSVNLSYLLPAVSPFAMFFASSPRLPPIVDGDSFIVDSYTSKYTKYQVVVVIVVVVSTCVRSTYDHSFCSATLVVVYQRYASVVFFCPLPVQTCKLWF